MVANGWYEEWRLEKADRFLRAAEHSLEAGDWETAVSRAYYAVYHATIAALQSRAGVRHRRWDHSQVQYDFRTFFANRGFLFNAAQAADIDNLYEARLAADYEAAPIRPRTARELVARGRRLYEMIIQAIRDA